MSEFVGADFFELDHLFSDEERAIRDSARDWVDRELIDSRLIEEHHRAGTFPKQLAKQLGEMGYLGVTIPEEYGCAGLNYTGYGLIMQELERGDSGLRSFCSVQSSLCMFPIYTFGTEEQKRRYLPKMAAGEVIGCFGLSEPDHGSDPSGMETKATPDGDGWILNGTKRWITNGSIADIAIVWARTPDGIRGFIVPTDSPGFSAPLIPGKFSLRASVTSELIMEDVKLGPEALLPETTGLKSALMCLSSARFGIAWGVVGSMMAVFDEALRYLQSRTQFDKPLASFQLMQRKLVHMHTELTKAQLVSYHLGRLKDAGKAKHYHISFGKRNNCWAAREVAKLGRELLGANGVCDEYQVMRHLMNIESVYTYEGTHEIHTLVLGEHLTGFPAYRG
ncbi:MAG: acyl-CoA dehydrogenase family protein [Planctomycetes bacterium]|nr:acyl-CoA dehydrogenase family protein [Planctomycetota bacterium]